MKLAATFALSCLLLAVPAFARHKAVKRLKVRQAENRLMLPAVDNLRQQNAAIDSLGLPRIKNDAELREMIQSGVLVPVACTRYVTISSKLPANRRYVQPWVNEFLQRLGSDFYAQFGKPLQVNSAVRTIQVQRRLLRWNHNAAPWHGEKASAHLAGVAVDIQRRGLTLAQRRYLRARLLYYYIVRGGILAEEELKQPCFHIVVVSANPETVRTLAVSLAEF